MRRVRWLCALTSVAIVASIMFAAPVGAGGGCYGATGATAARLTPGKSGSAVIEACAFQPTVLYVDEGTEVTWVNKDVADHTVTGASSEWGSETFLSKGDTISQKFSDEGVFPFYCALHPGMVGAVVVGDPDPDDVTTELSAVDAGGIELGSGDVAAGPGPAAAPELSDEPASDSMPTSLILVSVALLAIAAVVGVTLRRRGRVEQGA